MAVTMGQVTTPTSPSNIFICDVPPGATLYLTSTQTSANVFLGQSNAVTEANGSPLGTTGPLIITNPPMGQGFQVWGCSATGTDVVGFIVVRN